MGGILLVPETKMTDAHVTICLEKPLARRTTWSVFEITSLSEFRPAFLEPIPRNVFSINTSSSNTLPLFHNFNSRANTLSPVWLSYSPTDVKRHKMYRPCKHSFPQYTLFMRLFPASKTAIASNQWKKWTFKNTQSICIGHFYYLTLLVVFSCVSHTHTHTHTLSLSLSLCIISQIVIEQ